MSVDFYQSHNNNKKLNLYVENIVINQATNKYNINDYDNEKLKNIYKILEFVKDMYTSEIYFLYLTLNFLFLTLVSTIE